MRPGSEKAFGRRLAALSCIVAALPAVARPALARQERSASEAAQRSCLAVDFKPGEEPPSISWADASWSDLGVRRASALLYAEHSGLYWTTDGTVVGTRAVRLPCEPCRVTALPSGWLLENGWSEEPDFAGWIEPSGRLVPLVSNDGRYLRDVRFLASAQDHHYFTGCVGAEGDCRLWAYQRGDGRASPVVGTNAPYVSPVGRAIVTHFGDYHGATLIQVDQHPIALPRARDLEGGGRSAYFLQDEPTTRNVTLWRLTDRGPEGPLVEVPASPPPRLLVQGDTALLRAGSSWWLSEGGRAARQLADWTPPGTGYVALLAAHGGRAWILEPTDTRAIYALSPAGAIKIAPGCIGSACAGVRQAVSFGRRVVFELADGGLWGIDLPRAPVRLLAPCADCSIDDLRPGVSTTGSTDTADFATFNTYFGRPLADWITDGTPHGTRMVRTRPEGFVAGLARWVGRRRVVLEQATGSQRLLTSHEVGRAPSELAAWRPHGADGSPRELVAAPFGLVGDLEDRGAFALTDDGYTLPGRRFGLGAESRAVTPAGSLIVQERQGGNRLFAWRAPTELADLAPIADSSLVRFGNRIAWIDDETLWSTDGEAVDSLLPVGRLQVVGTAAGKLFLGDATGLTATDGTPAGTEGIGRGAFFDARVISDRGDRALLTTRYAGLWVSDGTAAATGPLVWRFDLHAMSSQPGVDLIFGTRRDRGGSALFTWDGTKLRGIRRLGGRVLETLPMGGRTIFSMRTDGRGDELWTSDGTAAGTRLLVDLWPGPFGSSPADLTAVAGGLVFVASTPSEGRELWFSDGTAAGTRLLADVYPGNASSRPTELVAIGDEIYFAAADESAGRELRSVSLHGRGCRERRETD